jgi:hypothetical protein
VGLPMCTVASCGQDGNVLVWTQAEAGAPWEPTVVVELQVRANAAHWRPRRNSLWGSGPTAHGQVPVSSRKRLRGWRNKVNRHLCGTRAGSSCP